MTDINLIDYQLNQEILNQPDYVLELWYGKGGLYFIKQLRKVDELEIMNTIIKYNIINDWLIYYDIYEKSFAIDNDILENDYKLDCKRIKYILNHLIPNCEIRKVW